MKGYIFIYSEGFMILQSMPQIFTDYTLAY